MLPCSARFRRKLLRLVAQVGKQLAAVRRELVTFTDARVKLCTEVITGAWRAAQCRLQRMHLWQQLRPNSSCSQQAVAAWRVGLASHLSLTPALHKPSYPNNNYPPHSLSATQQLEYTPCLLTQAASP